ncbi:unnamed protein product [Clonostachys rosea]|uniref:BTB domain-containing protein n=1 Tax=Bionectria ochroleuca TaxID=29856 RepID=A0ABY6UCB9_BIOOC|nr:unnamed protein product [Clonostachys rosea]
MKLLARFQDCKDSDCVVQCRGASFKVEQAKLRDKSPFFDDVIGGCYKNVEKVVLSVQHFRPHTIDAVLEFMYRNDYSLGLDIMRDLEPECETWAEAKGTAESWDLFHLAVGVAARFYEMESLSDHSRKKFGSCLSGVQAKGLAKLVPKADQLTIDLETQRMVAGAVAGAMQNEDNKSHFEFLKMTDEFRGLVEEYLEYRRKAREAVSKRLQEIQSTKSRHGCDLGWLLDA